MQNRRDFLKLLGFVVGASLTGCGSSGGSGITGGSQGSPFLANGYQFTALATSGGTLPNRSLIRAQLSDDELPFMGPVSVNDLRHVCFHATDQSSRNGVYRIDYEKGGTAVSDVKQVLKEGQVLPDGSTVDDISPGTVNNSDDCAFVVRDTEGKQSLQFGEGGGPFQKYLTPYDDVAGEVRLYGALHPEVSVSDSGDIMFCCNYREADGYCRGEGLFYIPGKAKSQARRVLSKEDLLPGTTSAISSFGIFDIDSSGNYLVHGSARPLENDPEDGVSRTYLLQGRVGEAPQILFADPSLGGAGATPGSVFMAPRLRTGGYGAVVQSNSDKTALYLNKKKLIDADLEVGGTLSPRGSKIISMFPPVFGPNGVMLVQAFTESGSEIIASNGQLLYTVLAEGDRVAGKVVNSLMFGVSSRSINSHGEFVTVAYFTDGTASILLGTPV